jgi:hypothetical protein
MPSPNGTNEANMWLLKVPVAADPRSVAFDERTDEFAATRADLSDPAKTESLVRLLRQRGVGDQEIVGLLEQLEGHGARGEQQPGRSAIDNLRHFLRGKGMTEDDISTACDISGLGPGKSARFGGAFNQNFGGNLHSEVTQQRHEPLADPGAKDRDFMIAEEAIGACPYGGDRSPRPLGGRDSFEELYGRQDRLAEIAAASRPRRPMSANQMAMDSQRTENFLTRFPEARRIRGAI